MVSFLEYLGRRHGHARNRKAHSRLSLFFTVAFFFGKDIVTAWILLFFLLNDIYFIWRGHQDMIGNVLQSRMGIRTNGSYQVRSPVMSSNQKHHIAKESHRMSCSGSGSGWSFCNDHPCPGCCKKSTTNEWINCIKYLAIKYAFPQTSILNHDKKFCRMMVSTKCINTRKLRWNRMSVICSIVCSQKR